MQIDGYLHGSATMRNEADIKAKLDELRADQKSALEKRNFWSHADKSQYIRDIEWVLAMRDEL